jgi:hypothetical protein
MSSAVKNFQGLETAKSGKLEYSNTFDQPCSGLWFRCKSGLGDSLESASVILCAPAGPAESYRIRRSDLSAANMVCSVLGSTKSSTSPRPGEPGEGDRLGFPEEKFGAAYSNRPGHPPLPTRLMAGLAMYYRRGAVRTLGGESLFCQLASKFDHHRRPILALTQF